MNEVDRLQAQIAEIQGKCSHDFEIIPEYGCWSPIGAIPSALEATMVPNVFIGVGAKRRIRLSVKYKCKKCSVQRDANCREKCAKCLGPMVKGERFRRDEFFGADESYDHFRVFLHKCEKCGFTIAIEEFDQ